MVINLSRQGSSHHEGISESRHKQCGSQGIASNGSSTRLQSSNNRKARIVKNEEIVDARKQSQRWQVDLRIHRGPVCTFGALLFERSMVPDAYQNQINHILSNSATYFFFPRLDGQEMHFPSLTSAWTPVQCLRNASRRENSFPHRHFGRNTSPSPGFQSAGSRVACERLS